MFLNIPLFFGEIVLGDGDNWDDLECVHHAHIIPQQHDGTRVLRVNRKNGSPVLESNGGQLGPVAAADPR